MLEGCIGTKRHVNDAIRETSCHLRDDEPIPFFCECNNERCCQAVWLTAPEYDQARAEPEWLALVPGHLATEDRATPSSLRPPRRSRMRAASGSPWKRPTREDPHGRCND
jgi:hypothetical protein